MLMPFFASDTSPLTPPCRHSLQLHDPRPTTKYKEVLHDQLSYRKVFDCCSALEKAAIQGTWKDQHMEAYKQLDTLITEAMLHAKCTAGKKYTIRYEWSPTLIKSIESIQFWHLLLKQSKGLHIHDSTIQWSREHAGIQDTHDSMDQPTIIQS